MSGELPDQIAKVFKVITGKPVFIPRSFVTSNGKDHAVSCSYRATAGYLYPLETSFFFIHKPPTFVRFEEIRCVFCSLLCSTLLCSALLCTALLCSALL